MVDERSRRKAIAVGPVAMAVGGRGDAGAAPAREVMKTIDVIARSFPTCCLYIASKAGVEGLLRVLANERRGRDVTVNALAPGLVATELFLHGKTDGESGIGPATPRGQEGRCHGFRAKDSISLGETIRRLVLAWEVYDFEEMPRQIASNSSKGT
jgi:NAD(P)-dependent dehydrogenase (short-subunit alcohol dehydrogenase family)